MEAELNCKIWIKGNGLCHCVRLGKIREIESEFSKIGVRMTRLRPNEVFRKFQSKNRFQIQVWIWKFGPVWARRENSRQNTQVDSPVDLGVDLVGPKSTALSTWSSQAVLPGAPFWDCVEFGGQIRFWGLRLELGFNPKAKTNPNLYK